jgi:ribosome-binding factor A
MGTPKQQSLCLHGLKSSAGFVQTRLAKQLTTRVVPHVEFVEDLGIKKAAEIAKVLAAEKAANSPVDSESSSDTDDRDDSDDTGDEDAPKTP